MNYINPLQSIPFQFYYSFKKKYSYLNNENRAHHIVVSLTSYPARFKALHLVIKSILNQNMKPDIIFLCLAKEEADDESVLPSSVLELKKYGLQIYIAQENLKPHNKYLYAAKLFPDSIIITIDDDCIYDKNLVRDLYNSFLKFPAAVSAKRVHKIIKDENGKLLPYNKWHYEYKNKTNPSFDLISTGVGGVLYPPNILPRKTFDAEKIKELCLDADDIWLKFIELKNNIPVVWVKDGRTHPLIIKNTQKVTLQKNNYHKNKNDFYISNLQNYFGINLTASLGEN